MESVTLPKWINIYSILLLGGLLWIPFLGGVHLFDWDEINFAECAREMIVTKNYLQVQINFQPFWEKPPLFFWMQVLSMKVFGINEFAARLPNSICGLVTLYLIYRVGRQRFSEQLGLLWALAYLGSILPHLYARSGIIDPWFNLFMFGGLIAFIYGQERIIDQRMEGFWPSKPLTGAPYFVLSGVLIGLAILTKGPVGLLLPGLAIAVYWVVDRFRFTVGLMAILLVLLFAAIVPGLWFGIEIYHNGWWFVRTFITYQIRLFSTPDAGHGGFLGYHLVVMLLGVFPAAWIAIPSFFVRSSSEDFKQRQFKRWMSILFWVVLILFSIIKTKIVHYSSLGYLPLTFLAAWQLEKYLKHPDRLPNWIPRTIGGLGTFIGVLFFILPIVGQHIEWIRPFFANDKFAQANLDATPNWQYIDSLPGLWLIAASIFLLYAIRRTSAAQYLPNYLLLTAIFVWLALSFDIKKIEQYSQGANIAFFSSLAGKDVYIQPVGYKSYAHLFYARKQPGYREESLDEQWLLTGPIDKDAYFSAKIYDAEKMQQYSEAQLIEAKNGFRFYHRPANH